MKVIALGNRLRGDDAIGPVILDRLKEIDIPIPLNFIEAGSDAFTLLEHLSDSEPVLLIDSAQMGCQPGTVRVFEVNKSFAMSENLISLHGFSFAEVLSIAHSLGTVAPCKIIGIQPGSIEFGQPLSAEVEEAIPEILNVIIEEAKANAEKSFDYR